MTSWASSFRIYLHPRVLAVLLLGFSSGLPLALTGATLAVRLTEAGVSLAQVGAFALVATPYSLKFLWAPLIDRMPLPLITRLFGRWRGWMLVTQAALMAALVMLGLIDPVSEPWWTAAFALVVAFCSASQDIVVDAYRVEILKPEQYGAGAAVVQLGYRVAMLVAGAGALFLAERMPWATVYMVMAGLVAVGALTVLFNPEPAAAPPPPVDKSAPLGQRLSAWAQDAIANPFLDMVRRHGWSVVAILGFVLLYKLGDAMAGVMANPFYVKMGFSKDEIAAVSKLFGFGATIIGSFVGGALVARMGTFRALMLCGVLQMASNLMFAVQAMVGHDIAFLTLTIAVENLSGGMGSAAFVAYISGLCNVSYTGTQYALLSSLASLARTTLASSGGKLVMEFGWVNFFVFSTVAAVPGLILLLWLMRKFPAAPLPVHSGSRA